MEISAVLVSRANSLETVVRTNGQDKSLSLPPRKDGPGCALNGGELLMAALATCYCNDLYREARKRGIDVRAVEVTVKGQFGAEGEPGSHFQYRVNVDAPCSLEEIDQLIRETDRQAEIHNTLRKGCPVALVDSF
ncbi:MAG TPA: OsmC family protein [Chitinophagaceae bacterium]|nr:OsmC family protein [Chitinophagaceae bacterium]